MWRRRGQGLVTSTNGEPGIPSTQNMGRCKPMVTYFARQGVADHKMCRDMKQRKLDIGHVDRARIDIDRRHVQVTLIVTNTWQNLFVCILIKGLFCRC